MSKPLDDKAPERLSYVSTGVEYESENSRSFKLDVDHRRNLRSLLVLLGIAFGFVVIVVSIVFYVLNFT